MADDALPPLDLVAPDGDRVTVASLPGDATVATLATLFGVDSIRVERHGVDARTPSGPTPSGPTPSNPRLVDIGHLRVGARLVDDGHRPRRPVAVDRTPDAIDPVVVTLSITTGPACSFDRRLAAGRYVIGRAAHADIVVDDPEIEWHHAILDVAATGSVTVTQLAGHVPVRLDDTPVAAGDRVDHGRELRLGATTLRVRAVDRRCTIGTSPEEGVHGAIRPHPTDPWRRVVRRSPAIDDQWTTQPVAAPTADVEPNTPASTGLVGAAIAMGGGVAIALLLRNPMFALFAGVGACASLGTWLVGVFGVRRRRRRVRANAHEDLVRFAGALAVAARVRRVRHEQVHREVGAALEAARDHHPAIWGRRLGKDRERADDALVATLGVGTVRWSPVVDSSASGTVASDDHRVTQLIEEHARLERVAAPLSIAPAELVAVRGRADMTMSVARSVVLQFATWFGPADWRLVVVTEDPATWAWTDWLPHGAPEGTVVVDASDEEGLAEGLGRVESSSRLLVVTDAPDHCAVKTSPLRRLLERTGASGLVVVDREMTPPTVCDRVLTIGATGRATWVGAVPRCDDAVGLDVAGITTGDAEVAARALACLVDPEDARSSDGKVPNDVGLADLAVGGREASSVDGVIRGWTSAGSDPAPRAPIGRSSDGVVEIDLARDGPHGLIAGTTGSGKSELLRSLVAGLALAAPPTQLNLVLVDYKGGATFDACVGLPHIVGLVTDLDDGLAERALISLTAELHRRERLLRSVGATDLTDYRRDPERPPIARLVVVIDEFAALAVELPEFLAALVGIAQRGRSLGVHLVLATQRPAGVVSDDIRANTNLRLALRLNDRADALDVVDDDTPTSLPRDVPGRAVLRLGPGELIVFQAACCTGPALPPGRQGPNVFSVGAGRSVRAVPVDDGGESELEIAVAAVVEAAERLALPEPHRPWLDPLPVPLEMGAAVAAAAGETTRGIVGLVDDPAAQCRRPLAWVPADGNLSLVGSRGGGTTSTLIALALATCAGRPADAVHLYVVDARGDDALRGLADVAHCAGVVGIHERERLQRLLGGLSGELDARRRAGARAGDEGSAGRPEIVLMIDGWSTLRAALGAVEFAELGEQLRRLVADGPSLGMVTISADDGTSTSVVAAPAADRWILHLDDPSLARAVGLRFPPVPAGRPGRLRIASSGLEAQIARCATGLADLPARSADRSGPPEIGVLPDLVRMDPSSNERWRSHGTARRHELVVGLGADDLSPATLVADRRDPIVVVGGPRSGVSTTVARLTSSWCAARDHERAEVVRVERGGATGGLGDSVARAASDHGSLLVVVDDAHRVDDPDGVLAAVVRGDHPGVTLLLGARADAVRSGYGHWVREAAKAQCGIVMSGRGDPDGDVLGIAIPRRPLVAARPGLGWVVDDGPIRQVQVAVV